VSEADLFGRRAITVMVTVALLSLGVGAVLALDSPAPATGAPVPSTTSRAATGHRAFLAFIRALGFTVRAAPAPNARNVLLVIEPQLLLERPETAQRLREHVFGVDRVLVLLPKWKGEGDRTHPGWLAGVRPLPAGDVATGLSALGISGSVERHDGVVRLHSLVGEGDAEIEHPQLMTTTDLYPLVAGPEGILVGERKDGDQLLIVVSDPDLFSNHGLRRGGNAAVAAGVLDRLAGSRRTRLVVDESLIPQEHRSLLTGLLHFPTVFAALQLLVCFGLCVWAGLVRFGAPLPEAELGPRGASALVEGAVALQLRVGRPFLALYALLEAAVRDTSERLHAPAGLTPSALDAWFESRDGAFGHRHALRELRQQVISAADTRRVLAAAQSVQRWRERMVHGTR
jgi:hypothetical protein